MRPRIGIAVLAAIALISRTFVPASLAADGEKKGKKLDVFWVHPDAASTPLRSVALLPAASYDNSFTTEREIDSAWGPMARAAGLRWYFSTTSKDLVRRAFGGDSVLKAVRAQLLKEARVDSLSARSLCQALHTSAVLTMRVDQWEKVEMEWNQTGKPWTRVQIKAALVDSIGRLLWTAAGSETAEGPMHEADSGTIGVKSSGLNLEAVTGQAGAPSFQEVLERLFMRWIDAFPARQSRGTAPAGGP
jgi:hypothetical protein